MTEKMGNTEHKEEDSFALYTEKIVPKPSVKYRRLIRAAKFFAAAVLFGLIASGVMLLVYPALEKRMVQRNTDKEILTIEKDEYPSEEQDNTETKETISEDGAGNEAITQATDAAALKNVATAAIKSLVLIDVYKTDMGNILTETQSATETVGLVIGQVNSEYIILTNAAVVSDSSSLVVKVSKATEVDAELVGSDTDTGIAIVSVKESQIPSKERSSIVTAQLDNSYSIQQGDIVVAAGRLYGQNKTIDYGMVSGISTKSGVDNSYEIISTGLAGIEGDYGYLFNMKGNVVGISMKNTKTTFSVLGISDLKSMIQELSNGNSPVYFGIKGQNVTGTMATRYGLPVGIYVTDIELDSPAYAAGIQPGDIITGIDGNMVLTIQAFSEKLYQCESGQQISITAKRFGGDEYKDMTFNAVIAVK